MGGKNIVLGGTGKDIIIGVGGTDILFGDNGVATFVNGLPTEIESIDPENGGDDTITTYAGAAVVGNLRNIVVGGSGNDTIGVEDSIDPAADPGTAGDVILGDNGWIVFDDQARVESVISTFVDNGGKDIITTSAGRNIVIGGADEDDITSGDEADTILGDNGGGFLRRWRRLPRRNHVHEQGRQGQHQGRRRQEYRLRRHRRRHHHGRRRHQRDPGR